MIDIIIE